MQLRIVSWLAATAGALLFSAQASAFDGKHHGINWQDELNLSDAQEEKIDDIEDSYRDKMRGLRRDDGDRDDKRDDARNLMSEMRADIHAVLNDEQKAKAAELIQQQHQKMNIRMARRVALNLDLTIEQERELLDKVSQLETTGEWPMDKAQGDAMRKQFNEVLKSVLTAEQAQRWDDMVERQKQRWHRPGEDMKGGERRPDGDRGLRPEDDDMGWNNWGPHAKDC